MTRESLAVTVDLRCALPFDVGDWEEAILFAIERVQKDTGEVVAWADPSIGHIDILVVLYQGTDHMPISEARSLEALMNSETRTVGRLCLFACGRTRGRGSLRDADVLDLLREQAPGVASTPIAKRALSTDILGNALQTEMKREIRRRSPALDGPTLRDFQGPLNADDEVVWDALSL